MRSFGLSWGAIMVLALLCGFLGGALSSYIVLQRALRAPSASPPASSSPAPQFTGPTPTIRVQSESSAIVQAAKRAGPAVVKVTAAQTPALDPMAYLFGAEPEPQVAIGSGFIINYEGRPLVLTNAHVVGQADKLLVKLTDGRELQGTLAMAEETSDIAAISLVNPPPQLPVSALGDSDRLQVGEWVLAIGNPYDYEHTVTVGVVSAMGYRAVGPNRYQNVIQTDAAINTGNSGGPLVNLAGEVVGINYRIFSPTGATVGIGFAIPINSAKQMLYFLTQGGPYIGLGEIVNNSPGLAQYLGLATAEGVLVIQPAPGGPAAQAGLQPQDVILAIDKVRVRGQDQLRDELLKHKIGDTIQLTIQRGERQFVISVVAGRHPDFGRR